MKRSKIPPKPNPVPKYRGEVGVILENLRRLSDAVVKAGFTLEQISKTIRLPRQ